MCIFRVSTLGNQVQNGPSPEGAAELVMSALRPLLNECNDAHLAAADAEHALSGRDTDWEFGGYYAASVADAQGMRRGRSRGHAEDGTVVETLRHFQTVI